MQRDADGAGSATIQAPLGRLVRAHRARLGFTQEQVAHRTGLTEQTLRNLEAGRVRRPHQNTIRRLADALELTGRHRHQFEAAARGVTPGGARQRPERQARWERASELFAQGRSQAEVARELDVSRASASRWHAGWQASGTAALQSRGPTGRPPGGRPKIPDSALVRIEQALLKGALTHGFATDVWTLERIAVVIQRLTGVALSRQSVSRLLRNRLGWSVQRPQRQAKEGDEDAIQHWVAGERPRIKKGQSQNRPC